MAGWLGGWVGRRVVGRTIDDGCIDGQQRVLVHCTAWCDMVGIALYCTVHYGKLRR